MSGNKVWWTGDDLKWHFVTKSNLQLTKHYFLIHIQTNTHTYTCVYIYIFILGVHKTSVLSWKNSKWHLKVIIKWSKYFNHLIDVKFPCLKLTMTPVWPWHDSIHQQTPISRFRFERQMNLMKLRLCLKWRRTPFSFLKAEMKLKLKPNVIELEKSKRITFLSFICGLFLLNP